MVECIPSKSYRYTVRDEQHARVIEIIRTRHEYQIEQENKKDKHQVVLRRKENGVIEGSNADLLIFERTDMGVTPDDFMRRMEKIGEFLKSSKPVFRCDTISTEKMDSPGETAETYGAHFKIPFMENRLILNTKYWIPEENLVIISG